MLLAAIRVELCAALLLTISKISSESFVADLVTCLGREDGLPCLQALLSERRVCVVMINACSLLPSSGVDLLGGLLLFSFFPSWPACGSCECIESLSICVCDSKRLC